MVLHLIFGMTMSPVSKYLQFASRIVIKVLRGNELTRISMPSPDKLEEYRDMIHQRHPALNNVWDTMDELNCLIEQSPNEIMPYWFYNDWKSSHYVTAVVCFVPDGTIPVAFFNVLSIANTWMLIIGWLLNYDCVMLAIIYQ